MRNYEIGDKFIIEIDNYITESKFGFTDYGIKGLPFRMPQSTLDALQKYSPDTDSSYKQGTQDAWELAQKVVDYDYYEREKIFGSGNPKRVFNTLAPTQIEEKIEQYERKLELKKQQSFHPGDIVISTNNNTKAILLETDDASAGIGYTEGWNVYTENGCIEFWYVSQMKKLNEHVDLATLFKEKQKP